MELRSHVSHAAWSGGKSKQTQLFLEEHLTEWWRRLENVTDSQGDRSAPHSSLSPWSGCPAHLDVRRGGAARPPLTTTTTTTTTTLPPLSFVYACSVAAVGPGVLCSGCVYSSACCEEGT